MALPRTCFGERIASRGHFKEAIWISIRMILGDLTTINEKTIFMH
jgi:hypothetical protein